MLRNSGAFTTHKFKFKSKVRRASGLGVIRLGFERQSYHIQAVCVNLDKLINPSGSPIFLLLLVVIPPLPNSLCRYEAQMK